VHVAALAGLAVTGARDDEAAPIEEGFRARALTAAEGFLRMTREGIDHYGDLETLVVYLTVVSAGGGRALRDPDTLGRHGGADPLPEGYYRPVSRRAVAAAAGLPRETVRRKIAWLAERGMVEDAGRAGVRATHNVLALGENLAFARGLVAAFDSTCERLARLERDGAA